MATIPSTALSGNYTNADIARMTAGLQGVTNQYNQTLAPTQEELNLGNQINDINSQIRNTTLNAQTGIQAASERPIALGFITGQQRAIENRANLQLQSLGNNLQGFTGQLQTLQTKRQGLIDQFKAQLEQGRFDLQTAMQVKQANDQYRLEQQRIALQRQAQASQGNGVTYSIQDIGGTLVRLGFDANGNMVSRVPLGSKTATAQEQQIAGYAQRVQQANSIFNQIEADISKYSTAGYALQKALPNFAKNSVVQQQKQAELNFLNAVLRRESGAAISDQEYKRGAEQYFPQPGDSKEKLAQKAANRSLILNSYISESGGAYQAPKNDPIGLRNGSNPLGLNIRL